LADCINTATLTHYCKKISNTLAMHRTISKHGIIHYLSKTKVS